MKFYQRLLAGLTTMAVAGSISLSAADRPDGLYATLNTTKGEIVLKLEFEKAPLTVANFVGLAEGTKDSNKPPGTKFYDGVIFHRVIPGFMIQGGDPDGVGTGGPGYQFPDEFDPSLRHDGPGVLSMANAGPGTNGSQFFITLGATPHLNDKHTVFGRVVEGQDVVKAIGDVPRDARDKPREPVVINSVTIERVGAAAKAFKADQATFDSLRAGISERQAAKEREALAAQAGLIDAKVAELEKEHDKEAVTTDSDLKYIVLAEGTGETPSEGTPVTFHYRMEMFDGTVLDSSFERGQPVEIAVGRQIVPIGLVQDLGSMKKGERRVMVVPSNLAFGSAGRGEIPPNTPLMFEVELLDF